MSNQDYEARLTNSNDPFNHCNSGISGVSLLVERALKRTLSGSGAVLMPYLGTSRSLNKTDESAIPTAEQFYLRMETSDHKDLVCGQRHCISADKSIFR